MPITRRYLCDDCQHEWTQLHWTREEPVPDCPMCETDTARSIPGTFAIKTNVSRAVDYAWEMAQERYGMTDMNDHLKEGDVAAKPPAPIQSAEAEQITRELMKVAQAQGVDLSSQSGLAAADMNAQVKNFWQPSGSPELLQQTVAPAAAAARADGSDPVQVLHEGAKVATGGRMPLDVVGRAKIEDVV